LKKTSLFVLTVILSIALFGCVMTSDNANEGVITEGKKETLESNNNQSDSEDLVEDNESTIEINTGATETVIRKVEGRDLEVNVLNYQIKPYDISFQLDEVFKAPEVEKNQITYSSEDNDYQIKLEVIAHTNFDKTVSNLQERFETEGYEEKGELEATPPEENDLRGKMQYFTAPMKGFYVYEIDEHVLVITYQYPIEGGDGMYPLLEDLRKSIKVQ